MIKALLPFRSPLRDSVPPFFSEGDKYPTDRGLFLRALLDPEQGRIFLKNSIVSQYFFNNADTWGDGPKVGLSL